MEEAVPQRPIPGIARDPNAPKIVDDSKPGTALELPKMWNSLIEEHSSKAKVYTQEEFLKRFGNGN
jgi:filamentous hemagglutinin